VYFYKVKGYLSAADLIKEVAANKQTSTKIGSSELIKKEFLSHLFDAATEIDSDAKAQLIEAIKSVPESKW